MYKIKNMSCEGVETEFIRDPKRVMERLEVLLLRDDHPRIHISYIKHWRKPKGAWHWIGTPHTEQK